MWNLKNKQDRNRPTEQVDNFQMVRGQRMGMKKKKKALSDEGLGS